MTLTYKGGKFEHKTVSIKSYNRAQLHNLPININKENIKENQAEKPKQ